MNIQTALQIAGQRLCISDTPQLDAQVLLAKTVAKDKTYLFTHPERELSAIENQTFNDYLVRREQGEPIAYIIGEKEFWSLPLQVTQDTLIPRPETEILVECALNIASNKDSLTVLDLGTGSGAIALAIASERKNWQVDACDQSTSALEIAQRNAQHLGLRNISFFISDWFNAITKQYDIIISNPPYIADNDPCWTNHSLKYEPANALISAKAGYLDLEKIIEQAPKYLNPHGYLIIEHGAKQQTHLKTQLHATGFRQIKCLVDYANLPRALCANY